MEVRCAICGDSTAVWSQLPGQPLRCQTCMARALEEAQRHAVRREDTASRAVLALERIAEALEAITKRP
jgi:hypothetical protein